MKTLWRLFWRFLCIGATTFGGGYSMLPMMERELSDKEGWVTREELLDYFAVGQCTPGVIAVNTATFCGYKVAGVGGAFFATLGLVTPSLVIITAIAALLSGFSHITAVQYALYGIKIAVAGLIISAISGIAKSAVKDVLGIVIAVAVFACSIIFNVTPVVYVFGAAVIGIAAKAIAAGRRKDG